MHKGCLICTRVESRRFHAQLWVNCIRECSLYIPTEELHGDAVHALRHLHAARAVRAAPAQRVETPLSGDVRLVTWTAISTVIICRQYVGYHKLAS
jgi:hypothetical protein